MKSTVCTDNAQGQSIQPPYDLNIASLKVSSELIEDRIYTSSAPIAQLARNSFVVVENLNGDSDLVAISGDKQSIVLYSQNQESNSGWKASNFSFDAVNVVGLEAAYYSSTTLMILLLVKRPNAVLVDVELMRVQDGLLQPVAQYRMFGAVSMFKIDEKLYWAGVSDDESGPYSQMELYEFINGLPVCVHTDKGIFLPNMFIICPSSVNADQIYAYSTFFNNHQTSVYRTTYTKSGGVWSQSAPISCLPAPSDVNISHNYAVGLATIPIQIDPNGYFSIGPTDQVPTKYQLLYNRSCTAEEGFSSHSLTNSQGLTALQNLNYSYQEVEGRIISKGIDEAGLLVVFAIDLNNSLWIIRQKGCDPNGSLVFGEWRELGDFLTEVRCPAQMDDGPEFFYINSKQELIHKKQDITTGAWVADVIETSSPPNHPSNKTSTYNMQIRTLTEAGDPAIGRPVAITANRKTIIIANNLAYHVDEYRPALLKSNGMGVIRLAVEVDALTAPEISVHCPDYMPTGVTEKFAADVGMHRRLAGQDSQFPVTVDSLKASGVLPNDIDSVEANNFVDALKSAGHIMGTMRDNQTFGLQRPFAKADFAEGGWSFQFDEADGMQVVSLSRDEVKARLGDMNTFSDGPALFEDTLLGDFLNYARQKIHQVQEVLFSIYNNAVQITLTIGGKVYKFFTKFVDDVASALHTILDRIESLYETAVDVFQKTIQWLRQLFDWEDILNTKQVLSYLVTQSFDYIKTTAQSAKPQIDTLFEKAEHQISDIFDQAENLLGQQSISGWSDSNGINPEQNPYQQKQDEKSMQMNYAWDHMMNASIQTPEMFSMFEDVAIDDGPLLAAIATANQDPNIQATQNKLKEFAESLTHPKDLLTTAVTKLLELVKDALVGGLEAIKQVILALLDLVSTVISNFEKLLTTEISIPVISDIYRELTGAPLTILDAFSLVISMPVTILYKLLNSNQAPFPPAVVKQILSQPMPWPVLGAAPAIQTQISSADWRSLSMLSAICSCFRAVTGYVKVRNSLLEDTVPGETVIKVVDVGLSLVSKASGFNLIVTDKEDRDADYWVAVASFAVSFLAPFKAIVALSDKVSSKASSIASGILGFGFLGLGIARAILAAGANPTEKEKLAAARGIFVPFRYISQLLMLLKEDFPEGTALAALNLGIVPIVFIADCAVKAAENSIS